MTIVRATTYVHGPWPIVCRDLVDAFGAHRVADRLGAGTDRHQVTSWARAESSPGSRYHDALKRLLATLYARELHADLLDLEEEREQLVEAVSRDPNCKRRRAKADP